MVLPTFADDTLPRYELSVSFDLENNLLRGEAVISLPDNGQFEIYTEGLNLTKVVLEGIALDPAKTNEAGGIGIKTGGVIEIGYEKNFEGEDAGTDPENVGVVGSVVSTEGISLTGAWYPFVEGLAYYDLKATVPTGFNAISEADAITTRVTPDGTEFSFDFPYPSDGATLVAGRYVVVDEAGAYDKVYGDLSAEWKKSLDEMQEDMRRSKQAEGKLQSQFDTYAYFFEEDEELAAEYLYAALGYIQSYEYILGRYPFKRFSVVENFLPTGYSMSTYTLLGRDVVRLPFIVKTSLKHEVLHQWFGNSVYADREKGNWLEGLTTYMSDHLFVCDANPASVLKSTFCPLEEYKDSGPSPDREVVLGRKKFLADFQSYATGDKAIPLTDFQVRTDKATSAVGYGKAAMVFHMLRRMTGDEAFNTTLRTFVEKHSFKQASWDDIREAFEETTGEDLGWFFDQWLTRKDVPQLDVVEPRVLFIDGKPNVVFKLRQKGEPYRLSIKVRVTSKEGEFEDVLAIDEEEDSYKLALEGTPLKMVLDPDYDVMRSLWPEEFAPTIARLLGDDKRALVIPEDGVSDYLHLTNLLRGEGFTVMLDDEVSDEDLSTSSVLLLGADGPVHRRLFAKSPVKDGGDGFEITVMKNPLNPDKVVAIAVASDREEVTAAARKIFRYGKYSHLKFIGGRNVGKDITGSEEGMKVDLRHKVSGVKPASAFSLDDILKDVTRSDIIYVGESHTNYEDHRVQLDVIRALQERGEKFAIGMEMFQRPFQAALDDYIVGETTEKEFLKASEYFDRWRFDYLLYREILQYARANSIPVVALNTDRDIIKKVSGGGLDALSPEEKEQIPPDMDMSDSEYRRKLEEIFGLHKNSSDRQFQNFYQSQVLWDETMAHSLDDYLKENPGHKMVVLAGMGHVSWGHGIPNRAYRLNGKDYVILINSNVETIEEGMADYVLFPEPLKAPETPKLGVLLKKTDDGVLINEVQPNSPAEAAKLRKGDIVSSVDGVKVEDIGDVKIGLFDHDEGDIVEVRVLRKRFLVGRKEMTLQVTLK